MVKMPGQRRDEPDVGGGGNETAIASAKLRNVVERVEHVENDMASLRGDRREIYAEAKVIGLDTKAIRALVRVRKDPGKAKAEAEVNRLYAEALGLTGVFG